MATTNTAKDPAVDPDRLRDEWLARFGMLVDSVETWARDLDWSTRRIEKKMDDHEIGKYPAPGGRKSGNRCQFSFPTEK